MADVIAVQNDIKIYEPIMEVQNIIGSLVDSIYNDTIYQTYLTNLENSTETEQKKATIIKRTFTDIRVFNTNANPLFLARDIGILMGVTNINSMIKNYNETEKQYGYILQKNKLKQTHFLTRNGVYRTLFNSRTKLSEVFRGFIYKLLDHMFQYEIDKLKSILTQFTVDNPNLVKESIVELYDNVNKYKQLYEIEHREKQLWELKAEQEYNRFLSTEHEKTEIEIRNSFNEMYIKQLEVDKSAYLNKIHAIKDDMGSFMNEDSEALIALKKRFLKEINIFIATPTHLEKLIKKQSKLANADATVSGNATKKLPNVNPEEYTKSFNIAVNDFAKDPSLIGDRELYYHIVSRDIKESNEKYEHIATDWIDKARYKDLLDTLKEESETIPLVTKKSDSFVYKTTLNHIREVLYDILIS